MPSFYVVAQYVPDPIADERVNIGVLVFGDGRIYSRFLSDWRRVRSFGGTDIRFLREFAQRVTRETSGQLRLLDIPGNAPITEESLGRIVGEWSNSIQFTAPRTSTLPPERLLARVWPQFLREPAPRQQSGRTRRSVAAHAYKEISHGLRVHVGDAAREYVKRDFAIAGAVDFHDYDLALKNGGVFAAVRALSFEVGDTEALDHEVSRAAWALDDVRNYDPTVKLAIVAAPPEDTSRPFERLAKITASFGADLVVESDLPAWAHRLTVTFADEADLHTPHTRATQL